MTCPAVVRVTVPSGPAAVRVSVPAGPALVRVATPGPPGPAGPSGARERRHDWQPPLDYLGTAAVGTAESAAAWRITRLTISAAGAVTVSAVATNVAWTARTSAAYS